ncbi:MAG: hypothetical protein KA260_06985 [Burkholderiales bacterium]|nr:hypothetical protein [Burkholderiales bacterium]
MDSAPHDSARATLIESIHWLRSHENASLGGWWKRQFIRPLYTQKLLACTAALEHSLGKDNLYTAAVRASLRGGSRSEDAVSRSDVINADHALVNALDGLNRFDSRGQFIPPLGNRPPALGGRVDFVSTIRIREIAAIRPSRFDVARLVQMLRELNVVAAHDCHICTAMLVRAIVDHIPPVFGKTSFSEVAGQHGGKSFKEHMSHLDKSLRKIADGHLHQQIRRSESVPTQQQSAFGPALDALLAEVVRVLMDEGSKGERTRDGAN